VPIFVLFFFKCEKAELRYYNTNDRYLKTRLGIFAESCQLPTNRYIYTSVQKVVLYIWLMTLLGACGQSNSSSNYVPKPKGYPRFDLPTAQYVSLEAVHPYQFEYNKIAQIRQDSFARAEPHWIFISYPSFQASVELTYKPVKHDINRLRAMLDDAYKLATRHQIKAASMKEARIRLKTGREAMIIDLTGEVASQVQFTTTDSTQHFLRGALYFNTAMQNDLTAHH
jgi:gliding motility-associated lipoprotein GldD